MFDKISKSPFLFLIATVSVFVACSNSYLDEIDRGAGYKYKPGFPELRVISSGFIDIDNKAYINIASEIVYGSMIFKKEDSLYVAKGVIDYQIYSKDKSSPVSISQQHEIIISDKVNRFTYNQDTYRIEKSFDVKPGEYTVSVTFTDQNTKKSISRISDLTIPDPEGNSNSITNIRIFTKSATKNSEYIPAITYDIPNDVDSLKFIFQITNNTISEALPILTKLLKFESDTSIAKPMNFNNYTPSTIRYKGIDFSEKEVINSSRRILTDQGNVLIESTFPRLERGNYRFEVNTELENENNLYKARDFSIKSKNYPSLSSVRELARPLEYIMPRNEFEKLISIKDDNELKKAMDRFWLSNIKNSQIAKSVIELYYERVEEANKQFSNYKEGWKTDQGMIYILFGAPWYIDRSIDTIRWGYSYNSKDPEKNFFFDIPKLNTKYYPFDNFILKRSSSYFNIQYQQIELWVTGRILRSNL